ncbi:TPA: HK97-gp10 family putative phage morphogenesis protein [Citrobacter freundii]
MIETSLDFSGLNDIAKDLEALSRAENNKVLRDATRAGAEVLKEEVIARAPVRTGKLKKNVVVVTQKSRRRGEISSGVHIRGVNPRTGNSDNTMKASNLVHPLRQFSQNDFSGPFESFNITLVINQFYEHTCSTNYCLDIQYIALVVLSIKARTTCF